MSAKIHPSRQISIDSVFGNPMGAVARRPRLHFYDPLAGVGRPASALKRAVDIVGSLLLLVTLSPLIAVLMALIALDGGSPFYSHVRVGHRGRPFRCWKLRTMVEDASERLAEILRDDPEAAAEWVRSYKLKDD